MPGLGRAILWMLHVGFYSNESTVVARIGRYVRLLAAEETLCLRPIRVKQQWVIKHLFAMPPRLKLQHGSSFVTRFTPNDSLALLW